ncbi:VWFA domain profile [Nakaseomyces glabratus]|nr:VWFA domain profile [Nakaseomyces glabratus]
MWDEKVDDNLKEKETDNQIENQNNESEDVQAAENEQQENGDEGSNKEPDSKEENNEDQQNDSENQNGDEQEQDLDNEESGEEDVGQQEDEVVNDEKEEQMFDAPEIETMELPEDMQLDSEEESKSDNEEEEDDMKDSGFESNAEEMEVEEDILDEKQNKDDMEVDNLEEENIEEENNLSDANEENDNQEGENNDEDNNDVDMQDEEQTLQEEPQTENGETGTNIDDEGAEGIENYLDNNDETSEANAEQNAGAKGAGADTKDDEDQENIGDSGMTNLEHQEQEKDSENHNDSSREKANEVLKELGDSLKEYHNRRQEINNPSNDENKENENKANQRPDEFEHLDGANTETDTQALGGANQEEANKIDDDLAINDDLDEEEKIDSDIDTDDAANLESHNEIKEELEEDLNTDIQKDTDSKSQGAFASTMKDLSIEDKEIYENDGLFKREDYENELDQLMDEIDKETNLKAEIDKPQRDLTESRELWRKSEIETVELSARLGEQLRLILEPTLATKLRGDYKTGKRLNMKRIIPYIASQYRKDKIWLRRTKPSKRQYQIMLALDNSKSMSESKSAQLAFNSLCLVSKTLSQLESGGLSIVRFGEYTKEVHSFDQNFSNDSGSKVFQWFNFQEDKTDVKRLVGESIKIFERARAYSDNDQWQLEIVISDGLCEDHDTVERLVRRARDKKIMLVFVIIDNLGQSNESIMDMSQVKYVPDSSGNLQLKITKYLDTFPFEFYVVVHDIVELPEMLALILRQYFSDLASQ